MKNIKNMKRSVIKIDEALCNGCGSCVSGCHEGALQLINGKAVMISDLYCDGLGACIGECPTGAIELIEKETEPYNEIAVMERISVKGEDVIIAHLKHLKNHNEIEWFNQGIKWCEENNVKINLSRLEDEKPKMACGCPGSMERDFKNVAPASNNTATGPAPATELRQWPVQLHLLNPQASFFKEADVLLASDCSAFSFGNFHGKFLKNKALAIACPKLDNNLQSYVDKLSEMIKTSRINTLTVLIMEVPCCGGLLQIAKNAREKSGINIPIKCIVLSVQGEVISENWV